MFQGSSPQIQRSMAKGISQGCSTWPMTCQSLTCMCLTLGTAKLHFRQQWMLTEHEVHCMLNAFCEWSLRLQTLWGRTFLLAVISIRIISHSDNVLPFSPSCSTKEISSRCILQQKQQRGRRACGTNESSHVRLLSPVPAKCLEIWRYKVF